MVRGGHILPFYTRRYARVDYELRTPQVPNGSVIAIQEFLCDFILAAIVCSFSDSRVIYIYTFLYLISFLLFFGSSR